MYLCSLDPPNKVGQEQRSVAPDGPVAHGAMKGQATSGENEGLLEETGEVPTRKESILEHSEFLKYGSLAFLILQNSTHVLLLRYSRVTEGICSQYVVRVPVFLFGD